MAAINVAAHEIEFRGIRSGVHVIVTANVGPSIIAVGCMPLLGYGLASFIGRRLSTDADIRLHRNAP
jgi:hypothetical protein